MFDLAHRFKSIDSSCAVLLPFDLNEIISDYSSLRLRMTKSQHPAFSRDEWAYLISFIESKVLWRPFIDSFGAVQSEMDAECNKLYKPLCEVGLWLPNNVSLLGPLTTILLSLSGVNVQIKGGSNSEQLTEHFLAYIKAESGTSKLAKHLESNVNFNTFSRADSRNMDMAKTANMRIVFGSNESAQAIHSLPHPVDSIGVSFADRQSEAWIHANHVNKKRLKSLLKVFSIYGRAGCTSPKTLRLIDADKEQAVDIKNQMIDLWSSIWRQQPMPHIASENLMASQCGKALSWNTSLTNDSQAMFAVGARDLPSLPGNMVLEIVPCTLNEAIADLPKNIQTLGVSLDSKTKQDTSEKIARLSNVKRIVSIETMHHFSHVWDGTAFWRQLFTEIELSG